MDAWWSSMDLFLKIMWGIAIPVSVIFVIQTIMTFMGMDADGDISGDVGTDSDAGHTPFQLFTFRNLVNFLLGFAWTGISFYNTIESTALLTLLAAFMGVLLVAIVMCIFYLLSKAVQSGNIDIHDTIGLTASVYIPIPAARKQVGKIQVTVRQAVREYDAVTDGEAIPTGHTIRIKEVITGNILLVEAL